MQIILIVNSTYGHPGNVAFRALQLGELLTERGTQWHCYARDSVVSSPHVSRVVPGGDCIPRALNFIRTALYPRFPSRALDRALFTRSVRRSVLPMVLGTRKYKVTTRNVLVHLWEYSAPLIEELQAAGIRVLLEVPIAPSAFVAAHPELYPAVEDPDERAAFQAADVLLAPSTFVRDALISSCGVPSSKTRVAPFGAIIPPPIQREYRLNKSVRFGFVGAVNRRKGVFHLLQAFNGHFPADELILCGRVHRELVRAVRHTPGVRAVGFGPVTPWYEQFDVMVFPTLLEGSAKVVYEAMAAGLPVITTPHAGAIIEDGVDGFLVPPGNAELLRARMHELRNSPELRRQIGERARATIERNYTWRHYAERVFAVYQELAPDFGG